MIVLIFTVCYLASPQDCHQERRVQTSDGQPLTMMSCKLGAQIAGAEYMRQNPEFQFRGWRCELGERDRA